MLVDRTTETISHFIGLFALKVEQERLRDGYEEFTAERRKADLAPVEPLSPDIEHEHKLRKTDAGPREPAVPDSSQTVALDVPRWSGPADPGDEGPAPLLELSGRIETVAIPGLVVLRPPEMPVQDAGVPGSMLTVTVQTARLSDDDVVGTGLFRDTAHHADDLAAWAATAEALQAPAGPGPGDVPSLDDALALHAAMQAFVPVAPEGGEVFATLGPAVPQIIVNGEAVEEAPAWKDLLPAYHQGKEETAGLEDWELPEFYRPNPDMPEGHEIVAGGNLLVNEAQIALSYLDAPLIAVGGTWVDLDIVSQVALVSNRDEGLSIGDEGATSVYQIVEVEAEAKTAGWTIPGTRGPEAAPARISVEIVDGDLIVSNTIDQMIELFDNDAFGMTISAAGSAFILGANIVVNATSLVTAGFGYDLILIGGDFISIDTIHQSLVLLDDDRVETGPQGATAAVFDTESALATEGTAAASDGIAGGVGQRADRVEQAEDDDVATDPAPDNLLVNKALLKTVGLDTAAELTDAMADILAGPSDDLEALREKLLNDPALAGLEQARVLKIDGDLILSNTIRQTIHAADRDDVFVDGAAPPGLDIVAGQNAMMNAASISLWGVDSRVMAGEGVYSDLLIHQARLVDEPDASADPGLVSEAVAFLMDDIQDTVAGKTVDVGAQADHAPADGYDLMQSTLT